MGKAIEFHWQQEVAPLYALVTHRSVKSLNAKN